MGKEVPDEGAVTAEFALALPAVSLLVIFCFGLLNHANQVAVLQSDLAQYARAIVRNEPEFRVRSWFVSRHPNTHVHKSRSGGALCLSTKLETLIPPDHLQHCVWLGDF